MDKIIKHLVDRCREKFDYYDIVDECSEMVDYGSIIEFLFTEITGGVIISKMETVATDINDGHKWTPASEPPKESGTYIVQTVLGAVTIAKFYVFKQAWQSNRTVTHWMPMPKPTKEGE